MRPQTMQLYTRHAQLTLAQAEQRRAEAQALVDDRAQALALTRERRHQAEAEAAAQGRAGLSVVQWRLHQQTQALLAQEERRAQDALEQAMALLEAATVQTQLARQEQRRAERVAQQHQEQRLRHESRKEQRDVDALASTRAASLDALRARRANAR